MLYWYPRIKFLDIPQPITKTYKLSEQELKIIHREKEFPPNLIKKIIPIISDLSYPIFARTDLASGKHFWKKTCFISTKENLRRNIFEIIAFNLEANFFGLPFKALIFREFIELETGFRAFYGGMPVARERRYFIRDGKIQCRHPYWPKDSINNPNNEDWECILKKQNNETKEEVRLLSEYALMVGNVLDGYWSVDFAYALDGKWYLIDMALGDESFHWLDCKYCPDPMKKQYSKNVNKS